MKTTRIGKSLSFYDVFVHKTMEEERKMEKKELKKPIFEVNDELRYHIKLWSSERSIIEKELFVAKKKIVKHKYRNREQQRQNQKLKWDLDMSKCQYKNLYRKNRLEAQKRRYEREELRRLREEVKQLTKQNEEIFEKLESKKKTEFILESEERKEKKIMGERTKTIVQENVNDLKDSVTDLKNSFIDFSKMIQNDFFENFSTILGDLLEQMNFVVEEEYVSEKTICIED